MTDARYVDTRRRYLDLLIRSLTNTIYGDPSMDVWHEKRFVAAVREAGRDWPSVAHCMAGIARLENLRDLVQQVVDERVPGDFIEAGVWRGGCCILMQGVLATNGVRDRKVYVADSFTGLPPPDPERYPADVDNQFHIFEELAVSVEQVKQNFKVYDLLDDNIVFVPGFFEDTLPRLDAGPFAVMRLDGDMYSSTFVALEALYPRLSPGGFVIIDDYGAIEACRQAVSDYRGQHAIDAPIEAIDWTGVWWRKPMTE